MDQILPILLKAQRVVYTTPLVWGGFSYDIKKILDKTSLIGDRFYKIRNSELVKGTLSKNKKIVGIGVSEKPSEKEQRVFENMVKEIGTIMNIDYMGKVINTQSIGEELEKISAEVLS